MLHQIQNQLWSRPPPRCRIIWWPTNVTQVRDSISSISTSGEAPYSNLSLISIRMCQPITMNAAKNSDVCWAGQRTTCFACHLQFLWCSALLQLTSNCKVAFWSIYNSLFWFNYSSKRGLILLRIYLPVLLRTHFITGMSGYVQLPAPKPAHHCCFTALHCIPTQNQKQWIY